MTGFQKSLWDDSHVHGNDQKTIKYLSSLCLLWEDVYYWGGGERGSHNGETVNVLSIMSIRPTLKYTILK